MEKRIEQYKGGAAFLLGVLLPNLVGAVVLAIVAAIISVSTGEDINTVLTSDTVTFIGLVLTQTLILLTVLLITGFGRDFKSACKLRMPENKLDFLVAAAMSVGVIMGLTVLSSLFFEFLGLFGYVPTESPFPDMTKGGNFVLGIFIIAMLPAFCEEMLFRGVIMNSLESKGKWTAILLSAFFFMLMHASPLQTAYQFALGVILAIVAYKSGSILLSMTMHFLNNLIAIIMEYAGIGDFEMPWYLIALGLLIVAAGLYYFLKKPDPKADETVSSDTAEERLAEDDRVNELLVAEKKRSARINKVLTVLFYAIAVGFCVVVWISQFAAGLPK